MFVGISSYTFPWAVSIPENINGNPFTARHLLAYANENKIGYVQFADNLPLHVLLAKELDAIRALATLNHTNIEVGTRGLTVANIERYIQLAVFFNSPFIRIVIDDTNYHPGVDQVIGIIREVLPLLRQNKVMLAIENHDRFPAAILKKIILHTDTEQVGICLDTANSLGAGEGIHEVAELLAPFVVNLHVKDIHVKRVLYKMGFKVYGVAAGDGIIDIPQLIKILKQTGRCKTATLELWSNPLETTLLTIQKEQELAKKSIHYLKQLLP